MELEQHPVTADGLTLMRAFIAKNSLRFADFVQVWNEHKFYYVYWVGVENSVKIEMTETMLRLGAHWFLTEEEFFTKLSGLYFLYAVYFAQPCSPKSQIRVTPDQWKIVDPMHREMITAEHWDAAYVLCQLRAASAFSICYSPRLLSLGPAIKGGPTSEMVAIVQDSHRAVCDILRSTPTNLLMEYYQRKQELELCLPPQLLNRPSLIQDIEKVLEDMGANNSSGLLGSVQSGVECTPEK